MGESATRILLGFVIAGAVVLAAGVVVLIWLLAAGVQGRGTRGPAAGPAALQLAPGERIVLMARGPDDLVLLLEQADGRQVLRTIDPSDGATRGELPVIPAR